MLLRSGSPPAAGTWEAVTRFYDVPVFGGFVFVFFSHLNLIIHPKELPGDLFFGWKTAKILRKWIVKKQTKKL